MPGRRNVGSPWWHGRFRGGGYRLTVPRQAILNVLSRTSRHLSAEDIYLEVHKVHPHVGLTTVYRTLELLAEMGMIFKFDFGDGRARYELSEGPKSAHHHHLICTGCRRVIDYSGFMDEELEFLKRAEKGLAKKYDFEIKSHLIQFYGLCDKCRKKKAA
ncbi:MAG: transcriptional repressor [Candidatus Makaraimicrobium thalassicum]|nr:MAG: transcriptional repressor [Candidatus Omnitrophota bacterium]